MPNYPSEDDLVPNLQWLEDAIDMLLEAALGAIALLFGSSNDRD